MHRRIVLLAAWIGAVVGMTVHGLAQDAPLSLVVSNNGVKVLRWPLMPGLDSHQFRAGSSLDSMGAVSPLLIGKTPSGYVFSTSNQLAQQYYSLRLQLMSEDDVLIANLLNRIAYGPTPDELERVRAMGGEAYLNEQLAPENVPATATPDRFVAVETNGVVVPASTNWTFVNVTGTVTSPILYVYLREPGQVSVDEIEFRYRYVLTAVTNTPEVNGGVTNWMLSTNVYTNITDNLVTNGTFELTPNNGWSFFSSSHASSFQDTSVAAAGAASLRLVATTVGTGSGNSMGQTMQAPPTTQRGTNLATGQRWTNTISTLRGILNFAYLQSANSRHLTIRLSQDGTVGSGRDLPRDPEWIYATATGTATATPTLYAYLNGAGDALIDDMKLVAGAVPEAGANLITNGDFEQPFATGWLASGDFDTSFVDNTISHSGGGSLRLVAEAAGGGANDSAYQNVPVVNGQMYTLSYWYRPIGRARTLTVRLSGSLVNSVVSETSPNNLKRRLDRADWSVSLNELRQWYCHNAVGSRRQLLEVLTQFFENHFVTQHSKTSEYFDRYYDGLQNQVATDLEYREISRWRTALMNPNCTFYDLLKHHVESPAQIIYLDTVGSRGDGTQVANENYARELFELFAMGVDNGYDQQDIVAMSRAWTGWTVDIVDRSQVDNPFATRSREYGRYPGVGFGNAVSNIIGVWTFVFNNTVHGTNKAPILSVWDPNAPATNPRPLPGEAGKKKYAARFGAPWAGTSYQLVIPPGRTTAAAAIMDGYDVIRHLSTNLYTAEFLSVKLCRLFVHEDFVHGEYDYADPNRSREAELVRQCILAWDTPGPGTVGGRGNIRRVLRTIFDSELFREYGGTLQKVKTPLEFVVSAVRAMRSVDGNNVATATTDGSTGAFGDILSRMGGMSLFNRSDPDGYPEYGSAWISAGTLAERVRFVQSLCTDPSFPSGSGGRPADAGNNFADPVALIQRKIPVNLQRSATAVVDYFLGIIFPGEGQANLSEYRAEAIAFLNDGSADIPASATTFGALTVDGTNTAAYDIRVRGMVAFLLTTQRFQEQ